MLFDDRDLLAKLEKDKEDIAARKALKASQFNSGNSFGVNTIYVVGGVVLLLIMYGIMFGTSPRPRSPVVVVMGGNFGSVETETAFIDPAGTQLLLDVLRNLTAYCTPPPGDPSLINAKIGQSHAQTDAVWAGIFEHVQGNVTNTTSGCYLYGLLAAQLRTGQAIGPVDMCHGYVHVGVDIFQQLYNFSIPPNIGILLSQAFDIAYPLNIFWLNDPNANITKQQVISQAYQILLCITTPAPGCTPGNIDIKYLATQLCNMLFAADDLNYYASGLMPWLSFPFPGLLQRNGSNVFAPEARKLLSVQFLLNVDNQTVGDTQPLKGVYIIGDVLSASPGMSVVLDALTGNVPRFYLTGSVRDSMVSITQNLQALDTGETILVVGRYAEDIVAYNGQDFLSNFYPTPLFMLLSNEVEAKSEFVITNENRGLLTLEMRNFATSWPVMNMVDFVNHLAFDDAYGQDYKNEKIAAQYLTLVSNAFSSTGMNETMQLLDSFALKNVLIDGVDFGGHIQALDQQLDLDDEDRGFGFHEFAAEFNGQVNVRLDEFGAAASNLPVAYDLLTDPKRAPFIPDAFDQGSCDHCWVVSVVQSMRARFAISGKTSGTGPAPLSIAHVTGCSGDNINGCAGNHPITALTFLALQGAVDETCFPTTTIRCSGPFPCAEPICQKNCKQNWMEFKDSAALYYKIDGEQAWMAELVENGPFATCFYVPTNFNAFYNNPANKFRCYDDEKAPVSGGHCVMSRGYDADNLYLRNSWKKTWGNNGDFCVKRGMARVQKTKWFTNEAWAGAAGTVVTQNVKTVIPATDNRQVQNALNTNTAPQAQVAPAVRPTEKPLPPNPNKKSAASGQRPDWLLIAIVFLLLCLTK